MDTGLRQVLDLFGGLALFLFGMDCMSEALEQAAGERMKRVLRALTRTPWSGAAAGAVVTAVLQSSSATTVMVLGAVSAGLLDLPSALAVIFGANLGTTMTAQLLAFRVEDLLGLLLFAGFFLSAAGRSRTTHEMGRAVFSLGLLFEGMKTIGQTMTPLAENPLFLRGMEAVRQSPAAGLLLGLGMTLTVQSSSATIAVLQNVAQQAGPDGLHSILGLRGAVPILLGDNVGTTITALLASIGRPRDAKRAAAAHCCFNLSGSLVCLCLLPWFVRLVEAVSPEGMELDIISRQIANAHTLFNALCTLVWLPLLPVMEKLVLWLIPEKGSEKKKKPWS